MKIGRWSTSAASNNATPPDGWPEGQAPSTVNDCARELMAQVKRYCQDAEWFDFDFTPTFINANSFSVPGDQTGEMLRGRALKLYDGTTLYRYIDTASFTVVTTISLGAGTALTSSLSSFAASALKPTNQSLPNRISVSALEATALSIGGAVTLNSTLTVSGATVLNSTLTVSENAVFNGTLSGSAIATKAQMEDNSAVSVLVTPGRIRYAPHAAKAWARIANNGVSASSTVAFNVTAVTRTALGIIRITFSNFLSGTGVGIVTPVNAGTPIIAQIRAEAASVYKARTFDRSGSAVDSDISFVLFGPLA